MRPGGGACFLFVVFQAPCHGKALQVTFQCRVAGQAPMQKIMQQLLEMRVGLHQLIMHPCAFTARLDNPCMAHDAKMPGYLEVLLVQSLGKHADTGFTICQEK